MAAEDRSQHMNRASALTRLRTLLALKGGSAIPELQRALEEYLSLIVGLTKKENGFIEQVEFKWKNIEDVRQEDVCVANSWFELLSVVHMMSILTLNQANSMLISKDHSTASCERVVSSDSMSNAVDLLLKAAGCIEFLIRDVLIRLPPDIKSRMPKDLHEGVLEAISIQALAQGTEIQLGLAIESKNATLSVKRRLACEQLSYLGQGMQALLDLICAVDGSVADAAKKLGLSTGALSRLILSDDSLRMAVNEFRTSKGMKPLK